MPHIDLRSTRALFIVLLAGAILLLPLAPSRAQHGTAIVALLIGDPATRSPGLIRQAEVLAVDAFYAAGGDERTDVFSLIAAMDLLAEREIDILNLSLAGPRNTTLETMVRDLVENRDIVVLVAAGNAGPAAAPLYRAAIDAVIAVTAVDRDRTIYCRAVQGAHVDIAAPGVSGLDGRLGQWRAAQDGNLVRRPLCHGCGGAAAAVQSHIKRPRNRRAVARAGRGSGRARPRPGLWGGLGTRGGCRVHGRRP